MVCVRETDVHVEHISGGQKTTLELALSSPFTRVPRIKLRFVGQTPTSTEPSLQPCPRKYDF